MSQKNILFPQIGECKWVYGESLLKEEANFDSIDVQYDYVSNYVYYVSRSHKGTFIRNIINQNPEERKHILKNKSLINY